MFFWYEILEKLAQRYQMASKINSQNSRRLNSLEDFKFPIYLSAHNFGERVTYLSKCITWYGRKYWKIAFPHKILFVLLLSEKESFLVARSTRYWVPSIAKLCSKKIYIIYKHTCCKYLTPRFKALWLSLKFCFLRCKYKIIKYSIKYKRL